MKSSTPGTGHHEVVIVGGGTAGITVAARLRRAGVTDIAVIEPSEQHYYQPLWTLVGAGLAKQERTARAEARVMPTGVTWIRQAAAAVDPQAARVTLTDGSTLAYEFLVLAPGLQLNFDAVPGLADTLGRDGVSSNYRYDLAPATWRFIRETRSGTALFSMPPGPVKCAGAPQKIAYLAADWWRRQGCSVTCGSSWRCPRRRCSASRPGVRSCGASPPTTASRCATTPNWWRWTDPATGPFCWTTPPAPRKPSRSR
ncbi:NAD(P)/FAD-dependent oxidoreductase [Paractinoplanes durhamensis]|uniref:NAD(P)/FAD-dependent oxidoreductase n=1 Tax=Paractinoplanes durhamensis TaxID=113563 RepID=UPI00363C6932